MKILTDCAAHEPRCNRVTKSPSCTTSCAALVALLCTGACSAIPVSGGSAISGRVVEAGTGRPIEGALVQAYWQGTMPVGGHTCAHVETAVTDREGRFRTVASSSEPVILGDREMRYGAYKSGMEMSYVRPGVTLEMRTFPGSREERLKELQRASRTALCSRQPSEGIADLKDVIAAEIQALVRTPSDESTYLVEARALARSEREAAANFDRHARPGRGDR